MYELLKRIVKAVLPKYLLINNEQLFRKVVYPFYQGDSFICNICLKGLSRFILLKNSEKLCPYCGSLGRNRRLFGLMKHEMKDQAKVLDFSPSRCLYRAWSNNQEIEYTSTDYEGEFLAQKKIDITHIDEPSGYYDIVICYHILEHIQEDLLAMKELKRIIKATGKCFIQTPFGDGDILEDLQIDTKTGRAKAFGQQDHVRVYSLSGLQKRLEDAGLHVKVLHFVENEKNVNGYPKEEFVLVAQLES